MEKLGEYRKKRNFKTTPEPSGKSKSNKDDSKKRVTPLTYVIQKHRASHLHYDFRLEWNGTLLSWAVPKGPSLDPSVKRLAMQVEDHPIDYAKFEGVIPAGEYGGGTVMVWDSGQWKPESDDPEDALRRGDLKFALLGKKLKGSWVLVRTRGYGSKADKSWLLIKHRDEFTSSEDITLTAPRSVVSDRLLVEIARDAGGDEAQAATGDPPTKSEKSSPKKKAAAKTSRARSESVAHATLILLSPK